MTKPKDLFDSTHGGIRGSAIKRSPAPIIVRDENDEPDYLATALVNQLQPGDEETPDEPEGLVLCDEKRAWEKEDPNDVADSVDHLGRANELMTELIASERAKRKSPVVLSMPITEDEMDLGIKMGIELAQLRKKASAGLTLTQKLKEKLLKVDECAKALRVVTDNAPSIAAVLGYWEGRLDEAIEQAKDCGAELLELLKAGAK